MSKPPPGILAPLAETRFGLEGDELARLEQLRREKQEQLRKGELDHEREIGTPAAARPKEPPAMKPAGPPRSKPGPKPKGEERPTTGLEALTAATRRVYDVFQELAPDGCRPVRQAEVADRLNVTCPAVAQHVQKMRAAGVYLDGWTAAYWGARSIEARPKADPAAATPAEQSVLDACERLAPGGSRPLPHAEIAESLGVTKSAVGYLVRSLRRKNLYREGWVIQHGYKLTRPRPPKPAVNADTPEPTPVPPPPPDSPATRSLEAHATKHRITAEERRTRERDAETIGLIAREIYDENRNENARRTQIGGDHYTRLEIQPLDVIEANAPPEGVYWFYMGNIQKYGQRAHLKNGLDDLHKLVDYGMRLIAAVERGKAACGAVRAPGGGGIKIRERSAAGIEPAREPERSEP